MRFFMKRFVDEFLLYSSQFVIFFILMLFSMPTIVTMRAMDLWILFGFLLVQILLLTAFGRKSLLRFIFSFITPAGYSILQALARPFDFLNMANFLLWATSFYVGFFQALKQAVRSSGLKRVFEGFLALGTIFMFVFFYYYLNLQLGLTQSYLDNEIFYIDFIQGLRLPNFWPSFLSFMNEPQHFFFMIGAATFGAILLANKSKNISYEARIDRLFGSVTREPPKGMEPIQAASGEIKELAVLYADIWNFSSLTEKANPSRSVDLLNRYYAAWTAVAGRHNGYVDTLLGDTVVVTFGMLGEEDRLARAVECAFDFLEQWKGIQEEFSLRDLPVPRHVGVGVHAGTAFVGELGTPDSRRVAAFGEAINVASRLDSLCREFKQDLLVSHPVYQKLPIELQAKLLRIGEVLLRGRSQPVAVYGRK